ncbi:ApeI family dehydratase [Shewanella chilikensis]|uniref:ApeI family dehydratase n=1 Tax=Shewanella chilikensis TaxID=558541 RepID=UPI001CFA4D63|nr:thioester dehydrase [Shewanella chilikensis]
MIKSVLPPILQHRHQDNEASWRLSIPAELPMFAGHFPGQPVLPGVTQLDWAVRLGSQAFGYDAEVAVLEVLKFQQLLLPNMQVTLSISNNPAKGKLSFSYSNGEQKFGSGRIAFKTEAKQ